VFQSLTSAVGIPFSCVAGMTGNSLLQSAWLTDISKQENVIRSDISSVYLLTTKGSN